MRKLIERYFDNPDKKAKLYILITIAQIWAVVAMVIGLILFIYFLLTDMGVLELI